MQNDTLPSPQAAPAAGRSEVAELAARVDRLERSARGWKLTCSALLLAVIGMGAYAANDAEFGTVKAKRFNLIGEGGEVVAELASGKSKFGGDEGYLLVTGDKKKRATFVFPGQDELSVKNELE